VQWLPSTPDRVVGVFEFSGLPPTGRRDYDQPGIQIRVRCADGDTVNETEAALAKMDAIYDALHSPDYFPQTINGTLYCEMVAQESGVLPLGRDQNNRPEFSRNFVVLRAVT